MELTADFRAIVSEHARNTHIPRARKDTAPDAFIREAYKLYEQMLQIQSYLKRIRKAYLSSSTTRATAPKFGKAKSEKEDEIYHLTDKQREEIDYEVKKNIREASNRIKELEGSENQRRIALEEKGNYLSRLLRDPVDDAANKLLATHRSGITWYLNHTLIRISQAHADTKTIRLNREEEKRLATHSSSQRSKPRYAYDLTDEMSNNAKVETELAVRETLLSPEQLQEFESENNQMLQEFENQLDQVRSVQTKLMEIAELSNELQQHLQMQTDMTDRLMDEAIDTTRDVTTGNQQLSQAKRRNATYRLYIVTILLTLGFTLLFLDYYAS